MVENRFGDVPVTGAKFKKMIAGKNYQFFVLTDKDDKQYNATINDGYNNFCGQFIDDVSFHESRYFSHYMGHNTRYIRIVEDFPDDTVIYTKYSLSTNIIILGKRMNIENFTLWGNQASQSYLYAPHTIKYIDCQTEEFKKRAVRLEPLTLKNVNDPSTEQPNYRYGSGSKWYGPGICRCQETKF
jgi:hypothetical protein